MSTKMDKLVSENRKLRLRVGELEKAFKRSNRNPSGELKVEYKILLAFEIILGICQEYEITEDDIENIGDMSRGIVSIKGSYIRPMDVTGQFILDLMNKKYEELAPRQIGDYPVDDGRNCVQKTKIIGGKGYNVSGYY